MYRVFLIDDEELIVNQVANTIPWMDNGFEVVGVETNPKKAIDVVLELKPDVVFTDLKMPILDGHSFIKELQERGFEAEFVMLSAYGTFEDARKFFQLEGFDYILKPIQVQEVELVLEKLAKKLAKKNPIRYEYPDENINPAFLELLEFVKLNFSEKFTLDRLSKQFSLSAGYICNLFSKHYNTTLTCYLTDIRLSRAIELMTSTNSTLKSIASECGYKDYFYFNKIFKDRYGKAPSQYLKDLASND